MAKVIFLFEKAYGYFKSPERDGACTMTYTKCQSEAYKFDSEADARIKIDKWKTEGENKGYGWRGIGRESKFIPVPD